MVYLITVATLAVAQFGSASAAESVKQDGQLVLQKEDDLTQLSMQDLVRMHNLVRPEKPITKFSDRATANKRMWPVVEYLADTNPDKESPMAAKKAKAAKKAAGASKKAKPAPTLKNGETKRGRRSQYDGMVINKLVDKNPRKEGTSGHKSWSLLRSGMKYEDYIAAGGVRRDLEWDAERKWVEIVKA